MKKQTLHSLSVLKKIEEDKIQLLMQHLSKLEKKKRDLEDQELLAREKLLKEKEFAQNHGAYITTHHFEKAIQEKIKILIHEMKLLEIEITPLKEELHQLYSRLKTWETLLEKGKKDLLEKVHQEEQKELDEMGITGFLRKKEGA